MTAPIDRAVVIGDGSWGTALAILLAKNGVATTLWSAFPQQTAELRERGVNERFLPGVPLPEGLSFSADPFEASEGAELAVSVVPTQFLRDVAERFEDALKGTVPVVSATKGLEVETLRQPSEILSEVLGGRPTGVLSGPRPRRRGRARLAGIRRLRERGPAARDDRSSGPEQR